MKNRVKGTEIEKDMTPLIVQQCYTYQKCHIRSGAAPRVSNVCLNIDTRLYYLYSFIERYQYPRLP